MNEEYFCKYCGDSHAVLSFLMSGVCPKSPNRRHQLYNGIRRGRQGGVRKGRNVYFRYYGKNHHYFCKYCGYPHVTITELARKGSCKKSPTGFHLPYEGEDKLVYVCKYCGSFSRSIKTLTRGSCSASPNRHHQPEE